MQLIKLFSAASMVSSAFAFPLTLNFDVESAEELTSSNQFTSVSYPGEKPIPGGSPVSICDVYEPKLLTVDKVTIDPNPPQKGANLSFAASGSLKQSIEEGAYVVVNVRYGYIKLLEKTFDLCEEIQNVDLTCPVAAGAQSLAKTVEIPDEVPPGTYTVYARAFTAEDEYITCLTATVTFSTDSYAVTDYLKFFKRMIIGA